MEREKLIELQLLNQQFEAIQQYLKNLDVQLNELQVIKNAIEEFSELKGDEDILVPISSGIFASGKLNESKNLVINVGDNTIVEKDIKSTKELLDRQTEQLMNYRNEAFTEFQEIINRISKIEIDLKEMPNV